MDNNPTGAYVNPGEAGSGRDAFEMFKSGASIDEINEKFFSSAADKATDANVNSMASENSNAKSGSDSSSDSQNGFVNNENSGNADNVDNSLSNSGEEKGLSDVGHQPRSGNDTDNDSGNTDGAASDSAEKKFSQAELDQIAGRVRLQAKGARDRLEAEFNNFKSEVAGLLGVDSDKIFDALKEQKIRREAENEGIEDVDLYQRARNAEMELEKIKSQSENNQKEMRQREFLDCVENQLGEYNRTHPDIDIVSVSESDDFNSLLRMFYANDSTRGRCVELTLNALNPGSVEVAANDNASGNETIVRKQVEANKRRQVESVSKNSVPQSAPRFDYEKMEAKDYDEIRKRIENGERIVL